MNILIVLPEDSLGGAEQYLKKIAHHYKDEQVYIYFFKNTNSQAWDNLKDQTNLHFLSTKNHVLGLLKFVFAMLRSKTKFDYIFTSHVYTNSLVGLLLSFGILKTKYFVARESTSIFIRYTGFKLLTYKLAYILGYRHINLLICQTEFMKSQLIQHFPVIVKRTLVKVLANPIDITIANIKSKEPLSIPIESEFVVSAGRLISEKGYDILINAFSEIHKEFPDLKLVILGNGNQRVFLEQLIASLDLKEKIFLLGHVENVYNYFNKAKLCVVSSRIEGFPNVLLQMMSQNNKVVSTICAGGIEDINGVYTCFPNDVADLEKAMVDSLNADTDGNDINFADYLKPRQFENFIKTMNDYLR